MGITSNLAAIAQPPHLKAAYVIVAPNETFRTSFLGGVPENKDLVGWLKGQGVSDDVIKRLQANEVRNVFADRAGPGDAIKYISIPIWNVGGWYDIFNTGAYFADGSQHLDYDTYQLHAAPDTTSDFAFKGALRDSAATVWRGMIRVEEGAQKTNAYQENRNLLLSKTATANSIPGLEILANDVRCTHGATLSQVDREQLFYLMARGLPEDEAAKLIVNGFIEPIVKELPMEYAVEMNRLIELQMEGSVG